MEGKTGMIYSIVYDAVRRKAATTPPNDLIANTEMAAAIGMICKELHREIDLSKITEPAEIKEQFLIMMKEVNNTELSEEAAILLEKVKKYKVKGMVNETLQDLETLTGAVI